MVLDYQHKSNICPIETVPCRAFNRSEGPGRGEGLHGPQTAEHMIEPTNNRQLQELRKSTRGDWLPKKKRKSKNNLLFGQCGSSLRAGRRRLS